MRKSNIPRTLQTHLVDPYWIGLNDAGREGTFTWTDGTSLDFRNWRGNEANNLGNEDYEAIRLEGGWNDFDGQIYIIRSICKKPAE